MKHFGRFQYMQYISACAATLSIACGSLSVSWPSPAIPQLTSDHSPIGTTLTHEEASWIASVPLLSMVPGALICGPILEKLGRKGTLLISGIPMFASWIAIIFIKSFWPLIVARMVGGVGYGIALTVAPIYIGEIAQQNIRGQLGTMMNILRLSGSLFILSVGPFIPYTALAISCSVGPLLFLVTFAFMPETPYYLMKKGKKEKARAALLRLTNKMDPKIIDDRIGQIEISVSEDMINNSGWKELLSKQYRRAFVIMFVVKTLQQFNGSIAIDAYTQTIISLSTSSVSPEISSIICGFIQIPAVLISTVLVDKVGRKPLLIVSALGCAIALAAEGVYFYLQDMTSTDVAFLSWLPTTALVLYLVMNSIGVFTLPYILLGELFPANIKAKAVSACTAYGCMSSFIVVKIFNPITQACGIFTVFWIFGGICVLGIISVWIVLPETKGKSFAEIQNILNRGKNDVV